MNQKEWGTLVLSLRDLYPGRDVLTTDHAVKVWFEMLKDLDYKTLSVALQKYAATNRFPPTIADLREASASVTQGETLAWSDGWDQVVSAIRNYGYMRESEALNSMTELTRRTVKGIGGWKFLCCSENPSADRANFRMIYQELAQREKDRGQLQPKLRELIDKATQIKLGVKDG